MRKIFPVIFLFPLLFFSFYALAQEKEIDANSAVDFLLSTQRTNGAFGPLGKEYTDLAWTYPAVHALKILQVPVPQAEASFMNGNQSWIEKRGWKNGPWYWSFYQKAHLFHLFNKKEKFEEDVCFGKDWTLHYKPRKGYGEFRTYPEGDFFDMSSLWHLVGAITFLEGNVVNPGDVKEYIEKRQSNNGGFVDAVAVQPMPTADKAHIVITHDAIMILQALGIPVPNAETTIEWIRSCQTPSGGFEWNPVSTDHSNKPDVWYTWAAVVALEALGSEPKDVEACIKWLNSLQNVDGGFGDRQGWTSRIYSTYYAVHALQVLTGDTNKGITAKMLINQEEIIPGDTYSIFQAHHKSPSGGEGMVDSIAAMNLNLVAVKSREKDLLLQEGISGSVKAARAYAKEKNYLLEIVESPENYSHQLEWINGQKADHVSDFMIPPDLSSKEGEIYETAYQAGQMGLSWAEFKDRVIKPIQSIKSGTLFYPELDYTMVNAYMVYDDGLDGNPGYNAVPGAHFGNIDWVRHFPYKERWEGVLPIIADGDAHGDMVKWRPNLEQYRNVFIAKGYSYADYVNASLRGRSVCVIRMPDTGEIRYYGAKPAIDYLKRHLEEWQWWDDPKEESWKSLFNGVNLEGWKQLGGEAAYSVEEGSIVGTSVKGTPNSFLVTEEMYGDFILELEVKADSGLNSGIQIRSQSLPEHENGRVHGYQVEIDPTERAFNGRIWDEALRRRWLDTLTDTVAVQTAFKKGEWNTFRIEAIDNSIKTWINGIPIAAISDNMTAKGFIGLQVHKTNKKKPMQVCWRNIRIHK
jgi:hypothetical protein